MKITLYAFTTKLRCQFFSPIWTGILVRFTMIWCDWATRIICWWMQVLAGSRLVWSSVLHKHLPTFFYYSKILFSSLLAAAILPAFLSISCLHALQWQLHVFCSGWASWGSAWHCICMAAHHPQWNHLWQGDNTEEQLGEGYRALSPYNRRCLNKNLHGRICRYPFDESWGFKDLGSMHNR